MIGTPQKLWAESLVVHKPLVTEDPNTGKLTADEETEAIRPVLMAFSKMAFLLRKNDREGDKMKKRFEEKGWTFTSIIGKTGKNNSVSDEPGFVAFRESDDTMVVTFRGSDSTVPGVSCKPAPGEKCKTGLFQSADWEVNLDFQPLQTEKYGKFHRGFYNKIQAAHSSLINIIIRRIKSLSADQKAKFKIWFTGHSQGAALAPPEAGFIAEDIKASKLLGPNFNNKDTNTIKVYVFSAPRALGDERAAEWLYSVIGKQNIVRQNVIGHIANDPVTVASLGKTATALLQLTPFIGQRLAKSLGGGSEVGAGYVSFGYLAGDKVEDVRRRVKPETVAAYEGKISQECLKSIQDTLKGKLNKECLKTVSSTALRSVIDLLAILHYAGSIKHTGSVNPKSTTAAEPSEEEQFFTSIFTMENAPEITTLLEQGAEHKKEKGTAVIRRGIEKLAKVKVGLENKAKCDFLKCNRFNCVNEKTFQDCQKDCPESSIKNCKNAHDNAVKSREQKKKEKSN